MRCLFHSSKHQGDYKMKCENCGNEILAPNKNRFCCTKCKNQYIAKNRNTNNVENGRKGQYIYQLKFKNKEN